MDTWSLLTFLHGSTRCQASKRSDRVFALRFTVIHLPTTFKAFKDLQAASATMNVSALFKVLFMLIVGLVLTVNMVDAQHHG